MVFLHKNPILLFVLFGFVFFRVLVCLFFSSFIFLV